MNVKRIACCTAEDRNADTWQIIKKTSVGAKTRRAMATDTRKAKMTTKVKMQI